jgi:2'-5' RNA ligase
MRLFVGIALSPEASDALRSVRARFEPGSADLRWSQPESWHVTLQFLGAASEKQAACVAEKLAALRAARVPVRMAGLGFFERRKSGPITRTSRWRGPKGARTARLWVL